MSHHGSFSASAPASKGGAASIFSNKIIRSILLSAVFLQLAIWVRNFAVLLFVSEKTDQDPVAISLISVAEFGPLFLFAFIGGAFADRWRPKRTMVVSDLLSAASIFVVLLTLVIGSWQAIFFATLVSSILSQFSQPAGMKLFKLHVPESQMQMGMSLYQTIQAVFMILGPMLGTFVYYRFGIETAVVIMGIGFALSAAVLTSLPRDEQAHRASANSSLLTELKEGFRYVRANRIFLYMAGFFLAAGLALGLMNPLGIYIVTEHLSLTSEHLQWLTAANGVGMIVGGMLVMGLSGRMSTHAMLLFGFAAMAAAVAVLGTSTLLAVVLVAQTLSGLLVPFIHISCNTLVMKNAQAEYVGRISGIMNPVFTGGMVLTMSVVGVLKAAFPLTGIYLAAALLFFVGAIAVLPLLKLVRPATPKAAAEVHA